MKHVARFLPLCLLIPLFLVQGNRTSFHVCPEMWWIPPSGPTAPGC